MIRSFRSLVALVCLAGSIAAAPQGRTAECGDWQACRKAALDAAARQDYEEFHDLAWRAVQKGPKTDPSLMTLLARAQSLSGRPGDALVMLQRLAGMGVITDAATSDDFRRVRALTGWAEFEATVAGKPVTAPTTASAAESSAASPVAAARKETSRSAAAPAATGEPLARAAGGALRFDSTLFDPAALAYDAVSNRFIVADRGGRKLAVIGERSGRLANLAAADTAGFGDIAALAIDVREGDLWVVSEDRATGGSTLHKLQLISGRVLYSVAAENQPVSFVDLAVTPQSTVLSIDAAAGRIFKLPHKSRELQLLTTLHVSGPVSIAAVSADSAYVAYADGLVRVDLHTGTAHNVGGPKGVLSGLAWIRAYGRNLIAVRKLENGHWQIVRLFLDGAGKKITRTSVLDRDVDLSDARAISVSRDTLFYVVDPSTGSGDESGEKTVRRLKLR